MKLIGVIFALIGMAGIALGVLRHLAGTTIVVMGVAHSSLYLGAGGLLLLVIGSAMLLSGAQESAW